MAAKKKRKKSSGKKRRARESGADPTAEAEEPKAKKKRAPKKVRKKGGKGTVAESSTKKPGRGKERAPEKPEESPADKEARAPVEVAVDLDLDDEEIDLDALVAGASGTLPEEPAEEEPERPAEAWGDTVTSTPEAEDGARRPDPVAEVLDEDDDDVESVDDLIAAAVAGVEEPDEEPEPEPVVVVGAAPPVHAGVAGGPDDAGSGDDEAPDEPRGEVSSPEARDRLLAQTLAHAELQDARYRVPYADRRRAARWKGVVATGLFLVAAMALASPPAWVQPEAPAALTPADRIRGIRQALLLQAEQVEAYRVEHQRLPDTLDELQGRIEGVRFVRSGNRAYQLIGYEADGNAVIYDSSAPARQFESARLPLLTDGDS